MVTKANAVQIGYDGGILKVDLDKNKSLYDYAALRAYVGSAVHVHIQAEGVEGFFYWDATDTASADNGGTIIVSSNGKRWKRHFNGVVDVRWFGAIGDWDGTTGSDAHAALSAAIQSGYHVRVRGGRYKLTQPLVFAGVGKEFVCDDGVIFNYTGTAAAVTITGRDHNLRFGEVTAVNGTNVIKYYNLSYSTIYARAIGACTGSVVMHDGASQTAAAGNNTWNIIRLEAGSVPYGIKLDSSATYTLEGEVWDVKVLFSATNTGLVVGSAAGNKIRWNEFNVSIDAQGITPLLVDVYNDFNFFNIRTWSGIEGNTHVRFNAGTGSNILTAQPGVEAELVVQDNGTNFYTVPGISGQMSVGGSLSLNLEPGQGSSRLAVGEDASIGSDVSSIENKSTANVTTKFVGTKWRGRDTVNTGKDVAYMRVLPGDANWQSSRVVMYTREGDVLHVAAEFLPDTSFAVAGNKIIIRNSQTPSPSSPGEPGTFAWDADYVYVCIAPNTWKRSALASW